jgi:pre-mRNA-splicing factor CDC5/CEF1
VKQDQAKKQIAERQNAPSAVKAMLVANEAAQQRRRGKMMLPAPQISDAELEQLARAGEQAGAMDVDLTEGGSAATRQLLGDYATPAHLATPMRTPARTPAAAGGNRIHNEALNLRMLQSGQTPLLGGDNPELHPSDFAGVTPRTAPTATPNPLAAAAAAAAGGATPSVGATPSLLGGTPGHGGTPGRGGGGGALPATGGRTVAGISATPLLPSSTPGRGGSVGPSATPTPMRDALGLNDPDAFTVAASKREEAARLALLRTDLRAGLGQLPAPRNEYQIVVPEMPGEAERSCQLAVGAVCLHARGGCGTCGAAACIWLLVSGCRLPAACCPGWCSLVGCGHSVRMPCCLLLSFPCSCPAPAHFHPFFPDLSCLLSHPSHPTPCFSTTRG